MENIENTEYYEEDALSKFLTLNSESIYKFANDIKSHYDTNTLGDPYVNILFDYTRLTNFIIELSGLPEIYCDNGESFNFGKHCDNSHHIKMNNIKNRKIDISSDNYNVILDSYKYVKNFTKNIKCITLSYEKWIEYATKY